MTVLKVVLLDLDLDANVVLVNKETLNSNKIKVSSYVKLKSENNEALCQVLGTFSIVPVDCIGLNDELLTKLAVSEGSTVNVFSRRKPSSLEYVKNKKYGIKWSESQIRSIVNDISMGLYTDLEISMFTLSQYYLDLDMDEIQHLTKNMAEFGTTLHFDEPVYDKHSIGGIPGNKVSLLIVPTVATSGLLIPKTSSRAITSPSGTADTMEVLCNVDFSADEILEIAPKIRGMLVWGGTLDLSPLDEIVIQKVEQPLDIDPHSQMLASIFSKKISTGVNTMVLDIPTGPGSKMPTKEDAINYAYEATELGRRLGIQIEAALSYGDQPLGRCVGPALEAKEALLTLSGEGSQGVFEKSVELTGILFEMANLCPIGQGAKLASDYIKKGKSLEKLRAIIEVQGGNKNIKPDDIPIGPYSVNIDSPKDGYVASLSNQSIKKISNAAGTPRHKSAGVILHKKMGEYVQKDQPLMTIYSDSETKLTEAYNIASNLPHYVVEGMILQRITPSSKRF